MTDRLTLHPPLGLPPSRRPLPMGEVTWDRAFISPQWGEVGRASGRVRGCRGFQTFLEGR